MPRRRRLPRAKAGAQSPSRDGKRQGEIAELAFLHKAASLGFTVSKPYGDSAKYDFVVDSGGRLTRVQVKSVSVAHKGLYRISSGSGHSTKHVYTAAEIDFLAAYVTPYDAWYLIPVSAFSPIKSIRLAPHRDSRRKFEVFRNAWELLRSECLGQSAVDVGFTL